MNQKIHKIPKSRHYSINNNLLKPYIQDMKTFFHFCDYVLLNYDVEYPDYYQQFNLKALLEMLNEKNALKDLNEPKLERLFKYNNNNFISSKKDVKDKFISVSSIKDLKGSVKESLFIDDELILIIFKDCLQLYNYKNKTCVSKLETDLSRTKFLNKINKDNIGIILYSKSMYILKIYSIPYNKIILEKSFHTRINGIKSINNNSFGIINVNRSLEVYDLIENSQSLELKLITNIETPILYDFIYLSNKNYLIALTSNSIIAYDKNYNIIKEVEVKQKIEENEFKTICETKDGHIILGPRIIGLFNINDWSYSILCDDNIPYKKEAYLTGVETHIIYSHFNITYFNKLIFKQIFEEYSYSSYEDDEGSYASNENNICIFDFNPENGQITKNYINKTLKPKDIYINGQEELIVLKDSGINVYHLK